MTKWKRLEREVARLLGTNRIPSQGTEHADIISDFFTVEHKSVKTLPQWFAKALQQRKQNEKNHPDKVAIIIFSHAPGQGQKVNRYVIYPLEEILDANIVREQGSYIEAAS